MMIRVPEESNFTASSKDGSEAWSVNPKLTAQRGSTSKSILKAIDFRETSPAASHKDMYIPIPGSSQVGGLAVGVPGELKGLWTAYEQFGSGRVSWERLLQPSVELSKGWRVSRELARRFRIFGGMPAIPLPEQPLNKCVSSFHGRKGRMGRCVPTARCHAR